jgi:hypothetical protein
VSLTSADSGVDDCSRAGCQVDELPDLELDAEKIHFLNQKIDVHGCAAVESWHNCRAHHARLRKT